MRATVGVERVSEVQVSRFAAIIVGFLVWSGAAAAAAPTVQLSLNQQAADAGIDSATLEGELRSALQRDLNLGDQSAYLTQMANAAVMSTKGMGVDYASSPQKFVIGGSVGTAVDGVGFQLSKGENPVPAGGFSFQAAVMAGLNLGFAAPDDSFARRIVLYGHGLGASGADDPFETRFMNFGGHLQFQLARPRDFGPVGIGGLAFTTGYERSMYELSLTSGVPLDAGATSWDATGTYKISSLTDSIPLELSTNMKVLVVTVYGGGGGDLAVAGQATSTVSLQGDLKAKVNGESTKIGEALVTSEETGVPREFTPRVFAGVQMNILMVKLYGQLNLGFDRNYGGHFGARVAF